jgi:hypothetical protein
VTIDSGPDRSPDGRTILFASALASGWRAAGLDLA